MAADVSCSGDTKTQKKHLTFTEPGAWIVRFADLVPKTGPVLDLAAGNGRHARLFLDKGHTVVVVDRDSGPLSDLNDHPDAEVIERDLEDGSDPFAGSGCLAKRTFAGIVVSNYLYRAHLPGLIAALLPGGVFLYDTFARGNEAFSKPRNPDHLLKSGELLEAVRGRLQVVAYEHGIVDADVCPGVKQRICAVNNLGASERPDGEPEPLPLRHGHPAG